MTFTITRPDNTRYLKMMVYGQPGAGKTTLAASAQDVASMRDVLFIDAESGSLSIANRKDIDVIRISAFRQFSEIYEFLKLHCQFRDRDNTEALEKLHTKYGASVDKRYRTVVVDSLTEVQKILMYMILGKEIGNVRLDMLMEQPQFKEWGQSAEAIRLLIRAFRDLPIHVIFVAAEQEIEDERKRLIKRPSLPGKLAIESQGFLDVVGYLAVRHSTDEQGEPISKRRLYLSPGPTYQAKHRFANGLTHLDNPTMELLVSTQVVTQKG